MEHTAPNPVLFMAINMAIVFTVLISLWILMKIVYLIDPTKKKAPAAEAASTAAPVAPAAPVATSNDEEVVAAITGAIVAMGYSAEQIASIRPTVVSNKWKMEGRLSGRN